jgi:hypothetical protein
MNTTNNNQTPSAPADKSAQVEAWTTKQVESARAVSARFNVPFNVGDWVNYGDYIGAKFSGCLGEIFIGIEKDGYAHS